MPADKITNYYSVAPQQYRRPMNGNITATYQKAEQDAQYTTNSEAEATAENFHLVDRIQVLAPELAYKTLKDHKESSQNYPTCRSINPNKAKSHNIQGNIRQDKYWTTSSNTGKPVEEHRYSNTLVWKCWNKKKLNIHNVWCCQVLLLHKQRPMYLSSQIC